MAKVSNSKNGGSITVVAGIDNNQTIAMMNQYLDPNNKTAPVSSQGVGDQTTKTGASTYGYPAGFDRYNDHWIQLWKLTFRYNGTREYNSRIS